MIKHTFMGGTLQGTFATLYFHVIPSYIAPVTIVYFFKQLKEKWLLIKTFLLPQSQNIIRRIFFTTVFQVFENVDFPPIFYFDLQNQNQNQNSNWTKIGWTFKCHRHLPEIKKSFRWWGFFILRVKINVNNPKMEHGESEQIKSYLANQQHPSGIENTWDSNGLQSF